MDEVSRNTLVRFPHLFVSIPSIAGDVGKLMLPEGMQVLSFVSCKGLTGDVGKIVLPKGMREVDFSHCDGLTGDVSKIVLHEGMQTASFTYCKNISGDVGELNIPVGMQYLKLNMTAVSGAFQISSVDEASHELALLQLGRSNSYVLHSSHSFYLPCLHLQVTLASSWFPKE
jgi:hypothetical protein